jgi:phospholipase/carboxylesterase
MKHVLDVKYAGVPLGKANRALILLHGRGGSALDILTLAQHLNVDDYALLAPQATNNTWYPLSFMAPVTENEPWLTSALQIVTETVEIALKAGIAKGQIYFFGFSQGACLSLEFLARNADRWGGAVAIIGGLIGQGIDRNNYKGDFGQMPFFLATSNPDFHVPVERVYASVNILREMNADMTERVYDHAGHTILPDHMTRANQLVFR